MDVVMTLLFTCIHVRRCMTYNKARYDGVAQEDHRHDPSLRNVSSGDFVNLGAGGFTVAESVVICLALTDPTCRRLFARSQRDICYARVCIVWYENIPVITLLSLLHVALCT